MPSKLNFYQLYELNRSEGIPNYITEDLWLLSYSLLRLNSLHRIESQQIQPLLIRVINDLDTALPQVPRDDVDRANRDFISVLMRLSGDQQVQLSEAAEREYQLLNQANGVLMSPLWQYPMDYGRFKPRGRYADSLNGQSYFKIMAYAGAVLFAVSASQATGISEQSADRMTRQAIRLTAILAENSGYKTLLQQLEWHMGQSQDLNIEAYQWLNNSGMRGIKAQRNALLKYAGDHGKQPQIYDAVVNVTMLNESENIADVLTGWRLVPPHLLVDFAIFQNLVFNRTGLYQGSDNPSQLPFGYAQAEGQSVKGYPSVYELMALAGSSEADQMLISRHEKQFQRYEDAYQRSKTLMNQAQGLNSAYWKLLKHWFQDDTGQGHKLDTALGFWIWQQYIGLLYHKQSYTLSSKSAIYTNPRPGAKITPSIGLYRNLIDIVKLHQQYDPAQEWREFEQLLNRAVSIAEAELDNLPLSPQQNLFLNNLDIELKSLTGNDYPVIVDIHTNPDEGLVVEEATGFVQIVSKEQARGARFSHYEFKQPINDRMNKTEWLQRLHTHN